MNFFPTKSLSCGWLPWNIYFSLQFIFPWDRKPVEEELPNAQLIPSGSFHPTHFREQMNFSHGSIFVNQFFWRRESGWLVGFPEKPETIIARNTGRKCVLERLKLQCSELHELAWFVFSGHIGAFGEILPCLLFIHLSSSILVFTYTHLQADITSAREKHSYSSTFSTRGDKEPEQDTVTGRRAITLPLWGQYLLNPSRSCFLIRPKTVIEVFRVTSALGSPEWFSLPFMNMFPWAAKM